MELSTVPQVALLLSCSEWRADRLLKEALLLAVLPRAFEALEWGLLTPEQASVVVAQLEPLAPPVQLAVWQRLLTRLQGGPLPPARLAELLRRWVVAADRDGAEQRRKQAERDRRIEYRRREDGLADVFALGLRGPDAQAILQRIQDRSASFGPDDDRTADQRRLDAFRDMLLGRNPLPLDHVCQDSSGADSHTAGSCAGTHDRAGCGCRTGQAAPCGADIQVLVPLSSALDISDEPAELVGHGPIESDVLQDLLLNAPQLTPVFVGDDGVPVAIGTTVPPPERGDPVALRTALLSVASSHHPTCCTPGTPTTTHPIQTSTRTPLEPQPGRPSQAGRGAGLSWRLSIPPTAGCWAPQRRA
jgi:hypothetical protein